MFVRAMYRREMNDGAVRTAERTGAHLFPDKKSKACTAVGRMCGLSTVVTPAGASLTMYREIRSYANSIWDDNNNNSGMFVVKICRTPSSRYLLTVDLLIGVLFYIF